MLLLRTWPCNEFCVNVSQELNYSAISPVKCLANYSRLNSATNAVSE
jgi:hypothetical protein